MEGMKAIPYIALVIAIAGVIIGAAVISLGKFGDTVTKCVNTSWEWNETLDQCTNITSSYSGGAAGQGSLNFTDEYYAIYQTKQGEGDLAEQLPTVAIIGVMVIIISIIAGVFVYLRYFA
jgi:hypothetical protein